MRGRGTWWIYFDASALIKRYAQEVGTPLVNEAFHRFPPKRMTCSTLGILEVFSILVRKRNDNRLSRSLFEQAMIEFRAEVIDCEEFATALVSDDLLLSALELIDRHSLNASDAVILRSALNLRQILQSVDDDLLFWAADKRLVRAAKQEGVTVVDPEEDTTDHLNRLLRGQE